MNLQQLTARYGIGLTGGIATGKSTVADMIRHAGLVVIDADRLARDAVAPGSEALAQLSQRFGSEILNSQGGLDRAAMRKKAFADPEARCYLESVVHRALPPLLAVELDKQGISSQPSPWFYEAALLCETGRNRDFAQLWLVHCQPSTQAQRLAKRGLDRETAEAIIAAQWPTERKLPLAQCAIDTEMSVDAVAQQVESLLKPLEKGLPPSSIHR